MKKNILDLFDELETSIERANAGGQFADIKEQGKKICDGLIKLGADELECNNFAVITQYVPVPETIYAWKSVVTKELEIWKQDLEHRESLIPETTTVKQSKQQTAIMKKIDALVAINGHTFSYKDMLKKKYAAFFHDGKWYVSKDVYEGAQKEIDALNKARTGNPINKVHFQTLRTYGQVAKKISDILKRNFTTNDESVVEYEYEGTDGLYKDLIKDQANAAKIYDELRLLGEAAAEIDDQVLRPDYEARSYRMDDEISDAVLAYCGFAREFTPKGVGGKANGRIFVRWNN